MTERLTDEELQKWAEKRADDAGRLARELVVLRAELSMATATMARLVTKGEQMRARVAKLEEALSETLRIYGRWLDGTFRERIEELVGVAPPKPDNDGPKANLRTPWTAPE